jgi:hypothetical protein
MNNQTLLTEIKTLVASERRIGTKILECLREIEKRKAYAELKYDGLFPFCIKELGFTEFQAYQRIQAMRALKSLPELKSMIESGTLSVSAVAKVQVHLNQMAQTGQVPVVPTDEIGITHQGVLADQGASELGDRTVENQALLLEGASSTGLVREGPGSRRAWFAKGLVREGQTSSPPPVSREEKLELFTSLQNCSTKEVDRKLAAARGEVLREKLILELDPELHALWTKVKNRSAHRTQGKNTAILKMLLQSWVDAQEPKVKKMKRPSEKAQPKKAESARKGSSIYQDPDQPTVIVETAAPPRKPQRAVPLSTWPNGRFIPIAVKREILKRDQRKCQRCGSQFALEFDHFPVPYALGGKATAENLRLLCRSCNQFTAIQDFGTASTRRE